MDIIFFNAGLADLAMRTALFLVGALVALHFACMSCATHGPAVPMLDALLIACTASSGLAACLYAFATDLQDTFHAAVAMAAFLVVFLLRLWALGFHASSFYKQLGDAP